MKLQIALDMLSMSEALRVLSLTKPYVDVVEIGTALIKHEGSQVLKAIRAQCRDKEILVDLKTMDAGEYEADPFFYLGADLVTVLGVADLDTIKGVIRSAKKHRRRVVVDLMNVSDLIRRAYEAHQFGADFVAIHSGIDQQRAGKSPLGELRLVRRILDVPVVVAGGINRETVGTIAAERPNVIVVGGAITGAPDPAAAARARKRSSRRKHRWFKKPPSRSSYEE